MIILGIESSCDETAVAIVENRTILSNTVASQNEIHAKYGGVVPELASRKHIEVIVPLLQEALSQPKINLKDIDGVAATRAPGLIGALLVGLSTAKAIALGLGKPLIGVNHLEGHINAIHLTEPDVPYPHIGLIVSGGHTSLYLVENFGKYRLLGSTRDDAAGEAYDKVARLLHLGYPGGPIIDKLSNDGDPNAIKFKRPKFSDLSEFDFSFSGIKTAVMFHYKQLSEAGKISSKNVNDLIASFQRTVVEILAGNIVKAAKLYNCKCAVVSGGVAANQGLRTRLKQIEAEEKIRMCIPPMKLCTDNAAMIAYVGGRRLAMGESHGQDLNANAVEEIGN